MTRYEREYQYGMDITWFFLGADGSIAEFSSGGAILPDVVAANAEDNQHLIDYFTSLPDSTEVAMSPLLDRYMDLGTLLTPAPQLGYSARKGLVSFDKINPNPGNHRIDYLLLAQPVHGLTLSHLPPHIQSILLKTRQPINFRDFYRIDAGYLPWASLFSDYHVETVYQPLPEKKPWKWFPL